VDGTGSNSSGSSSSSSSTSGSPPRSSLCVFVRESSTVLAGLLDGHCHDVATSRKRWSVSILENTCASNLYDMQEQIELFEQWQWQLHGMDCDDATPRPSNPTTTTMATKVFTTIIITIGAATTVMMTGCAVSFVYKVRDWNVRSKTMTTFMGRPMTPLYDKYP
jgi:hypothetical protein